MEHFTLQGRELHRKWARELASLALVCVILLVLAWTLPIPWLGFRILATAAIFWFAVGAAFEILDALYPSKEMERLWNRFKPQHA